MRYFRFYLQALAAAALILIAGCTGPEAESQLSISVPVRSVDSGAGDQMIRVTATGDWTITLKYSDAGGWASVDPSSGKDSKSGILFRWDDNTSPDSRSCTLVLQSGKALSEAVFVQNAYVPVPEPVDPDLIKSDPVPAWLELPATVTEGLYFITHDMFYGAKKVRNYSYYYDAEALLSRWVAYPLNKGLRGTGQRTNAWGFDPKLPQSRQQDVTQTYSADENGVRYDRGHQIPSADRYLLGANEQTFYGTNMTPQLNSLNSRLWELLESSVRGWSDQCDTLYVVTGADIKGSTRHVSDLAGKKVTVPVGYFKALVAYSKSSSEPYRGIAFYMDQKEYPNTLDEMMSCSLSIRDLEKKMGTDFFVNLPSVTENAEKVETTVDKWWANTVK